MPVRIYELAKELKLDSGELSDICTKAGVTGKGSALASLTDDEADKVRDYISGRGKAAKPAAPADASGSTAQQIAAQGGSGGAIRREDYVAPAGTETQGRPRVLKPATPADADKPEKPETPKTPKPVPPPAIKLAPMPEAPTPADPTPEEISGAQKPDMKLPVEAMRASRSGATPLSEHLKKHERRRSEGDEPAPPSGKAPSGPAAPAAPGKDPRGGRRKGKEAPASLQDDDRALLGGREARQIQRKRVATKSRGDDDDRPRRRLGTRRIRHTGVNTAAPRKGKVTVELPCTVRSFSEAIGVSARDIQRQLMQMEQMVTINSQIEPETAELLALELGADVEFKQPVTLEDELLSRVAEQEDDPASLTLRPPVVTFLGHVDHGKTSLLDRIIGIDVVSGESGGITQHIRAYEVTKDDRQIAFVDTPGHEAFTEMRARGANVTDIAVLVVAADDGVMPQTEEAISHARAAEVPIVVALNKIDLPGVDENRIMQELAANELLPTAWGGDVEVIRTSAITGDGIDELLEMLLFIAEDKQYQANPSRAALGTCLEAQLHEGRGVVSKFIVQNGTLKIGDCIVCGSAYGRIKTMYNTLHTKHQLQEAGPSTPVDITGLDVAPAAGERFYVLEDIAEARRIAEQRDHLERTSTLGTPVHVTLEGLFDRLGQDEPQTLNLILRADVRGSIEAIQQELEKLVHPEVKFKILQASVGGITEADVYLADASDAIICGFNVVPDEGARALADARGIQIRRYDIIYNLTDDLKKALEGMLKPEEREAELGRALVQQTFKISRVGTVAGCRVLSGIVQRGARVRVVREQTIIGDYPLEVLKRIKDDVKEVREGLECGIKLGGFNDVKEGDILEVYKIEEIARTLDSAMVPAAD
ncbi:MAG: translation initiation factor IF-2 [Planctomycetota bacterium]|nr:MAG: translation initiation factor IF-2 [Planctomycetota bacterium]REK39394.1 MAG: translation initiation factor IF-2 [Planctomycetota bacterium]